MGAAAPSMTDAERRTRASRIAAMRADHARVLEVEGTYEDAVRAAADFAQREGATIVSDTSWPGYEEIPRLIMAGYTRLLDEASRQWSQAPDIVIVQGGVGGLVCAAASWFAFHRDPRPFFVACEPDAAACLLASARAHRLVVLDRVGSTMMAGLRCAEPSPVAWPAIHDTVDAFVAISDRYAQEAMNILANPNDDDPRIEAGPSGACGVGALLALLREPSMEPVRRAARLGDSCRILLFVTEGA